MKRFFDSRWGLAVWFTLIALLSPVLLSVFFCWLPGLDFWYTAQYMFFLFCGSGVVSALLLILTNINEDLSYGFGAGLYYGTIAIAYSISKLGWYIPNWDRLILSFTIAALVCYIVWLEKFK